MKYGALALAATLGLTSCGAGRRAADAPVVRPNEVRDFRLLYAQNCSGCHGADGQGGLTVGVGDPVYLAIADDSTIHRVTSEGVRGTAMPAFAQKAGGLLTDEQVEILVRGIRARWAKTGAFDQNKPPAYAASQLGDAAHGQNVFLTFCSRCHGSDGRSGRGGDRGQLISFFGNRPAPSHSNHYRDPRVRRTGLAWGCAWQTYVRHRDYGRCRLALGAAHAFIGAIKSSRRLAMSVPGDFSRRQILLKISILFNGIVGVVLAIPIVRYLLSPVIRGRKEGYESWISLGPVDQFPSGQTRLATYRNPVAYASDGEAADVPCWVRHTDGDHFQVFAINCAHLGCPVRWFPQSGLFMCPCHGGAYYADGASASGPPERGLFEYSFKILDGKLQIQAGEMPTPGLSAGNNTGRPPCV